MYRTLRILIVVLGLTLAGCNQATVIKAPVIAQFKNDIVIRLVACNFVAKPIGDGMYLIKWDCPWQE
jgi:hypothetical protein